MDKNIKQGERYELRYYNEGIDDVMGHVVTVEKNENNEIIIYDPQNGDIEVGNNAKNYIESWGNAPSSLYYPEILRVDDKALNPYYINDVVKKRSK